jgi:hypothetical protein
MVTPILMKFSRAISRVKWLSGEQTNVSKTISVLVLRVLVWLTARENFIILSRRESNKSHTPIMFHFDCEYRISGGNPKAKISLGRPKIRWEDDIRVDFKEVEREVVD